MKYCQYNKFIKKNDSNHLITARIDKKPKNSSNILNNPTSIKRILNIINLKKNKTPFSHRHCLKKYLSINNVTKTQNLS